MGIIEVVARGLYAPVLAATPGEVPKVFYDQLPLEARGFLEEQARSALGRLREAVTPGMVEAAGGLEDAESIFCAMLDHVLKKEASREV